jgi:hypothetical protein
MQDAAEYLPSRSSGLAEVSTIEHLLGNQLIPGAPGVILANKSVSFAQLWKLTSLISVEVSLTRDLHHGELVFRLRSGTRRSSPITRPSFGLIRIIAHTHPSGRSQALPSFKDIEKLNELFLHKLRNQADHALIHSRVIYGPETNDYTIFWPTVLR